MDGSMPLQFHPTNPNQNSYFLFLMEKNLHVSKRGRTSSSKNIHKEPLKSLEGFEEYNVASQLKVLEIDAGADVINAVKEFTNRYKVDVSVISTHGLVCNLTIYRSMSIPQYSLSVEYKGVFNLLSLKGDFFGTVSSSSRPSPLSGSHRIHIVDQEENSIEGFVVGSVIAVTKVFLGVVVMKEAHRIKLPLTPPCPSPFQQTRASSSVGGLMTAYGIPYQHPLKLCNPLPSGCVCTTLSSETS